MAYEGDILAGSLIRIKFTTLTTTGAPTTLSGTPVVSVYKADSTTESVAGVTLTVDFDARTGLNHIVIDTSADGTFYAAGNDFQAIITTGTVGGTSVVGYVCGEFSIENRTQKADIRKVSGNAIPAPNVSGVLKVDVVDVLGSAPNALQSGRFDSYVGAMAANVLTATAINAAALNGKGDWLTGDSSGVTTLLTRIPSTITPPTNFSLLSIDGSGRVDLGKWLGGAIPTPTNNGIPTVDPQNLMRKVTTAQGGSASTITLDSLANATDQYYRGARVVIKSGTGSEQERIITNYVGSTKVATVSPNWTTAPDNTSVIFIGPGSADVETWKNAAATVDGSGLPIVSETNGAALLLMTTGTGITRTYTVAALANAPGGSGSDPWLVPLPGAYTAGEAGYILGHAALAGSGGNIINQNQGGTNNLQPTIGNVAQPNVTIRAYLQSDFAAGRVAQAYVKDQTITDSNGNWTSTMALASGTYAFTYNDNRDIYPASQNVAVP